jgi:hypothetical protein
MKATINLANTFHLGIGVKPDSALSCMRLQVASGALVGMRDQACARLTHNLSRDEWEHWFPKQPYRQICANLPPAN